MCKIPELINNVHPYLNLIKPQECKPRFISQQNILIKIDNYTSHVNIILFIVTASFVIQLSVTKKSWR